MSIAALIIFMGACSSSSGSIPVTFDSEYTQEIHPEEDAMRTVPEDNYFEWWYFDFTFSNGMSAVIVFSTKNIIHPESKPDPQVSIIITDGSGNRTESVSAPGYKRFSASVYRPHITVGDSCAEGDLEKYRIHFENEGITADLNLVSKAPPWRPGSGKLYFGRHREKYFAWLAAVPYGLAEGKITMDGRTERVTGTGYHDHNWGNVRLDKVMTQWYWGRARIDNYTLVFSQMLTSPRYGSENIPVFYLAENDKIISSQNSSFTLSSSNRIRHRGGRDYPEQINIRVKDKDFSAGIIISNPVFIDERYLLKDAPLPVRIAGRLFVNPWYFRFKSDYRLCVKDSHENRCVAGDGIFEIMLLRKIDTKGHSW